MCEEKSAVWVKKKKPEIVEENRERPALMREEKLEQRVLCAQVFVKVFLLK